MLHKHSVAVRHGWLILINGGAYCRVIQTPCDGSRDPIATGVVMWDTLELQSSGVLMTGNGQQAASQALGVQNLHLLV